MLEERPNGADRGTLLFNLFISFIGAGILSLPFAFSNIGVVLGTVCFLVVALLCVYCMVLLVEAKYAMQHLLPGTRCETFGSLGRACFGVWGQWAVDVPLALSQVGFCIGYLLFITANISDLFGIKARVTCAAAVPMLIFLVRQRHLKALGPFSLFADVANASAILVVFCFDAQTITSPLCSLVEGGGGGVAAASGAKCRPDAAVADIEMAGVPSMMPYFVGVAAYCFEGTGLVLPLEASVRSPRQFPRTLVLALLGITTLEAAFGIMGYLAYGSDTAQVITLNMPPGVFSTLVRLCLCMGLYFTFPIMMFPVVKLMDEELERRFCIGMSTASDPDVTEHAIRGYSDVGRVLLVLLACFIAMEYCPEGKYQDLAGETSCKDCGAGTFQTSEGMAFCVGCAPGKFGKDSGQSDPSACKDCPPGRYQPFSGNPSYPAVSKTTVLMLRCHSVDNRRYLLADYSVRCDVPGYTVYKVLASFFTILYPIGIPVMFAFVLAKNRRNLPPDWWPENIDQHENEAFVEYRLVKGNEWADRTEWRDNVWMPRIRKCHKFETRFGFLFNAYKHKFYWFESVMSLYKLAQTTFVVFVSGADGPGGTTLKILYSMFMATCLIALVSYLQPYKDADVLSVETMVNLEVLFVLFAALYLQHSANAAST
eukprot:g349.t1